MKQNFLILLLAAAALSSCDDDTATPVQPQTTESKPMSFSISTANFYDPTNPATRSGEVADIYEPDEYISQILTDGILLSCINITADSVIFSNYVYMGNNDGKFYDYKKENVVETPMWPGNDKVVFCAYYNGLGATYYSDEYGEVIDDTMRRDTIDDVCHWRIGISNSNGMVGGSDLMVCTDTTSSKEGTTVQLKLQHILTQFKVTAQRASDNDSINVTSFSVSFPDTVVYDFNEGKIKRIGNASGSRQAVPDVSSEITGGNTFQAYTMDENGGTSYSQEVTLTETSSGTEYWYFAVPDSLVFDFGYQLIYATTAWVDKTGHLVVEPTAGQKISYVVKLPGDDSATLGPDSGN